MTKSHEPKVNSHVVTVLLHDYFHRHIFKEMIGEKQWSRFESRLEKNVDDVCNLFEQFNIKATFFTLGWIAEMQPEIIEKLVSKGHEIASAGYGIRSIHEMTRDQFREDLYRARRALENAGSNKIIGYRCAYKWIYQSDLWALDVLAEEGYLYDASYRPPIWNITMKDPCRFAHKYQTKINEIWEFPVSTYRTLGFNIPISGGNYLRQLPQQFITYAYKEWDKETDAPFVLYFHPWEIDPEQPRMNFVGLLAKIKQYRNLGVISQLLPKYFESGQFKSISQYLGINLEYGHNDVKAASLTKPTLITRSRFEETHPCECVSVVIPVYNEAHSIPYLSKALDELVETGKEKYKFNFVFIDDGSTDDTYAILSEFYGNKTNFTIIRHESNQGIASALMTGFITINSDIICSIDADCSYDPIELLPMISMLKDDNADVVIASPYHKDGIVLHVPRWRLFLSKSLSKIYHFILNHKFGTYTSCFRVYRRSALSGIDLEYGDYRGIIELIAKLDIKHKNLKEYPTTLQSRIFGQSKMQVFRTILGHLKLLIDIIIYRCYQK